MPRARVRSSKSNAVIIGDSRDMKEVQNDSIHLVVTSPPYPMIKMWDGLFGELDPRIEKGLQSGGQSGIARAYDLMHQVLKQTISECSRVLVDGAICCVNIGDAARTFDGRFQVFPNHATMMQTLEDCGLRALPYILWKKPTNRPNAFLGSGFLPTNAYVTLDCEFILLARKGGPRVFRPKDPRRYRSAFTKKERDKWFSQIWSDIPGADQKGSTSESRTGAFPVEIPRRLIRMFSVEGDTVLDPFMGTGTTMHASLRLNRRFVGYEIDEMIISPLSLKESGCDLEIMRRS